MESLATNNIINHANDLEPVIKTIELNDTHFQIKEYPFKRDAADGGNLKPQMNTGNMQEVLERYNTNPLLIHQFLGGQPLPYTFLGSAGDQIFGNYTNGAGEFLDIQTRLLSDGFQPHPEVHALMKTITQEDNCNFTKNETLARIGGLDFQEGKLTLDIGFGKYSDSFLTNGKYNRPLNEQWRKKYPNCQTVGDMLHALSSCNNQPDRLPDFQEPLYNNSIGVACMVLTQNDEFVYVLRDKKGSAVNLGINCTAGGAVKYDKTTLEQKGIHHLILENIDHETRAELGCSGGNLLLDSIEHYVQLELGTSPYDYQIIPLGAIREITRGGKPEFMFLLRYMGTTDQLVRTIKNNRHKERVEVGGIYAQAVTDIPRLLDHPMGTAVVQHKGMANLALAWKHLDR